MANRAYLYSSNGDTLHAQAVHKSPYYDSRHLLPIAWLLFFNGESIRPRQVTGHFGGTWFEVLLVRSREAALRDFRVRLPCLADLRLEAAVDYELFLDRIRRFPDEQLVLDPQEILAGDGMEGQAAAELFNAALTSLEGRDMAAFAHALRPLTGDVPLSQNGTLGTSLENFVIGVTYWA
jgi:hypothetical protein